MKVVLLENLRKLGNIGETINVKRGYARNFLIPQKKALFASDKNIKEVEKIKSDLNQKDQEKKKLAREIAEKLKNKTIEIKKLVTESKELYGSVKPTEISKILKGVVGFTVELEADVDSNAMDIYINYGDSKRIIELGSGIEKMMASLAIRVALINVSSIPPIANSSLRPPLSLMNIAG